MPFEGYFIDAGTPESYLEANFKLLDTNIESENNELKNKAVSYTHLRAHET